LILAGAHKLAPARRRICWFYLAPDREFQADVARLCGAEAYEVLSK